MEHIQNGLIDLSYFDDSPHILRTIGLMSSLFSIFDDINLQIKSRNVQNSIKYDSIKV